MKAMILAAGLGTRLRPLTDDRPKALVEVAGQTLLEITLRRLRESGIREVIVNIHHFPDMIATYLQKNANFGMHIEISREDILLDTGGGLKKAAWFFLDQSNEPFLLHNVDVLSSIDFARMLESHCEHNALATLAVQNRETSRYLLFDENDELCGRKASRNQPDEIVRSTPHPQPLAFAGLHIISPRLLTLMTEEGVFSIINVYLRLAAQGEKIRAFHADPYYWRDLGKPENISRADHDVRQHIFTL